MLADLSQLAVGFANGSVTVVRGDLIHDRGAKQRTVFESQEPITGLEVREGAVTTLYIATTARISTLVISGRGQGQPARTLEDLGCGVGCMALDKDTGEIIIARDDAISYYGLSGRARSFAFEGPKKLVKLFKEYIALICPPRVAQISNSTSRRFVGSAADELLNTSTLTLVETDLRFVGHTETMTSQVKTVFAEWGDLFLLTLDGKVSRKACGVSYILLTEAAVSISREDVATEA